MPSRRQQQVADLVLRELSVLIQRELKDPRIGFVTLTKVEMSPDLRHARVFYSVYGTDEEQKATSQALERASGFLRRELGGRLDLRYVPDLNFRNDVSIAHSDRIARLLTQIEQEPQPEEAVQPADRSAATEGEDRVGGDE